MDYPKIPKHIKGGSHDTVSMHCTSSLEEAKTNFDRLKSRLLAVNEWHTFSEKIKATFTLFDTDRNTVTQMLKVGNFIKIDIPGPGSPSGHGFDWVKVIDIKSNDPESDFSFYAFTLQPCAAPDADEEVIAHFYTAKATNTFMVKRLGTCIYSEVCGRNEIENTSEVPILDLVRNKAVAMGGLIGFGKLNWMGFTSALLEPFNESDK